MDNIKTEEELLQFIKQSTSFVEGRRNTDSLNVILWIMIRTKESNLTKFDTISMLKKAYEEVPIDAKEEFERVATYCMRNYTIYKADILKSFYK